MDAILFGFLFLIGAVAAIFFLKGLGSAAQDATSAVLNTAADAIDRGLPLMNECYAAGLKIANVEVLKPGCTYRMIYARRWVNAEGVVYGSTEEAVERLRREKTENPAKA